MSKIFTALVISYILVIGVAFALGLLVEDKRSLAVHFGMGLFATIFTCLIYCVVITYFIITGKMIKQAVLKGHFEAQFIRASQDAKGRIIGLSAVAVLVTLGAAIAGTLADGAGINHEQFAAWHMIAQILSISINLGMFYFVYQHIRSNADLVGGVFGLLNQQSAAKTPSVKPLEV